MLHVDRGQRVTGALKVLLCRITLGEGMLGLMGVEHRSSRRSLSDLLDSWVVFSTVVMGLTCHTMKLLDLGKWVDDKMWSIWLFYGNSESSSDANRGPLSL